MPSWTDRPLQNYQEIVTLEAAIDGLPKHLLWITPESRYCILSGHQDKMHARRYLFKALETDEAHMGPALHLIARLYAVEDRAKTLALSAEQRLALRQRVSARLLGKLHQYLLELQPEVLPKSPSGAAVRYTLNQWEALSRFLEDGDLEIDNGATERANRDIALGRNNWTFFGSDNGGKTAAVLLSFVAICKRNAVEPFAWFHDVLSRIATHPVHRLAELLPQNWKPLDAASQTR